MMMMLMIECEDVVTAQIKYAGTFVINRASSYPPSLILALDDDGDGNDEREHNTRMITTTTIAAKSAMTTLGFQFSSKGLRSDRNFAVETPGHTS